MENSRYDNSNDSLSMSNTRNKKVKLPTLYTNSSGLFNSKIIVTNKFIKRNKSCDIINNKW